jgi:hypothetical protein
MKRILAALATCGLTLSLWAGGLTLFEAAVVPRAAAGQSIRQAGSDRGEAPCPAKKKKAKKKARK